MPLYEYKCGDCNHEDTELHTMATVLTVCPKCKGAHYQKQISHVHTDLQNFHKPIEMFSVAADTPEEVRKFQQQCPDIEISDDQSNPMYGVPIAKNRKGKMQALAAAGFSERN